MMRLISVKRLLFGNSSTYQPEKYHTLVSIRSWAEIALLRGQLMFRCLVNNVRGLETDLLGSIPPEVAAKMVRMKKIGPAEGGATVKSSVNDVVVTMKNPSYSRRNPFANSSKPGGGRRPSVARPLGPGDAKSGSLVARVVSKWVSNSVAADVAKQSLIRGTGLSLGLIGVCIKNDEEVTLLTEKDGIEMACREIRRVFANYSREKVSTKRNEQQKEPTFDLESLDFGSCISKGCNAVVYNATIKPNEEVAQAEGHPLAVKMMFNYDAESNASSIWRAMSKECIPFNGTFASLGEAVGKQRRFQLNPHPNIVDVKGIFAGQVPWLPDALELYPNALPARINEDGYGRNMTLFLVMKRYDVSLKDFLVTEKTKLQTSLLLFTQLCEAVSHLVRNGVAHRDLKSDNVLLDLSKGSAYPWLVVTDFGCCSTSLRVQLSSDEVNRGGNGALMAPEIITAEPGPYTWLDYSASDLWAVGAIAYEIFGGFNPFYPYKEKKRYLVSYNYDDADLPEAPQVMPKSLRRLVETILKRDPCKRPNPRVAACLGHLLLHASPRTLTGLKLVTDQSQRVASERLLQWLRSLSISTLCNRKRSMNGKRMNAVEARLRIVFLSQVKMETLLAAVEYLNSED